MKIKGHFDRRGLLQLSAFLGAGLALPQTRLSFAAEGDLLRIRSDSDITRLDPAFEIGNLEDITNRCVLISLVRLSDMRKGNTISPWGAETIEQTDPKTITFTLRPGLKWTGGFGAVTPEDVKYSFERIADPKNESPWKYQFEKLDTVEVKDERTGIIHLKEPFQPIWLASLPYYGGHIVCKAAVERAGVDTTGFSPMLLELSVVLPVATMTTTITAMPATVPSRPAIKTFSMARGIYPVTRRYTASRGCHPRRRTPRWSDDARQTRHSESDVLRAGDRDERSVAVRLPRAHAERPGVQAGRAPARARQPPPGRPRRLTHGGCVTQPRWEHQRCMRAVDHARGTRCARSVPELQTTAAPTANRRRPPTTHPPATASRPPT